MNVNLYPQMGRSIDQLVNGREMMLWVVFTRWNAKASAYTWGFRIFGVVWGDSITFFLNALICWTLHWWTMSFDNWKPQPKFSFLDAGLTWHLIQDIILIAE